MAIEDLGSVEALPDGSKMVTLASGAVVTIRPDGSKLVEMPGRPARVMPKYTPRIMTESGIQEDHRFDK